MYKRKIIKLLRKGHKQYPTFIIAVSDGQSNKGFIIEKLGYFNPNLSERKFFINGQKLAIWVNAGAKINYSVIKLISYFCYKK